MSTIERNGSVAVGFPSEFYALAIFRTMNREMIDQVAAISVPLRFGDGEQIFEENDPATALFLIEQGAIRVTKRDDSGSEREITVINTGSVCGEMSLLAGTPRSCSGQAVGQVVVYKIQRAHFYELLGQDSIAAYRMLLNLCELMGTRMRSMDEKLVQLLKQPDTDTARQEMADLRTKLFNEWAF